MKNKEKYLNEMCRTLYDMNFSNCDFAKKYILRETQCKDTACSRCCQEAKEWLEQEYKPPITEDEKTILKYVDKEYKWIAREYDNSLAIYKSKPFKGYDEIAKDDTWLTKDNSYNWLGLTHDLFPFIKKEDTEPYNIEELLNEN